MPSLLRDTECGACGHRHHFCLLSDDLTPGREYAYVCPETAKKATLRPATAAQVVQSPPQGAVVLTLVICDFPQSAGHASAEATASGKSRPQARPEGGFESPAAGVVGLPGIEREVHQIEREMQGLAARIGELEGKAAIAPPAAVAPPDQPPPGAGANEPKAGRTRLQDVLPEVKDLAGKVGGLEQLSDIVETLKEAKKA